MKWDCIVPLALAMAMVPATLQAQTAPPAWPTDAKPPATAGAAPWPGQSGAGPASGPAPMVAPAPMMGMGMGGAPGDAGAPMGNAGPSPAQAQCMNDFRRLRGDTEKYGAAAKAASERKVTREEMCKVVTNLASAEGKWFKYATNNKARCAIPPDIIDQLKQGHTQISLVRKSVCAEGPSAAPPPPSLSEALGTATMPTPTTSHTKRGGTLDTLTGNPIR